MYGIAIGKVGVERHANRFLGSALPLVALVLMLSSAGLTTATRADAQSFDGYIEATALNVRVAPGGDSPIVSILLKFDPVSVVDQRKVGSTTWYSIEASGGYTSGWVAGRFVKRGAPPATQSPANVDYGAKQTPTLMTGGFQYVGAKTCQECHEDSVSDFPQGASVVWQKHFHSSAYQTLKRDYTKEIAQRARGIEDPANDWRCVKCHVTALGAAPSQLGPGYNEEEGVGCEVCHGPGGSYAQEDHGPDIANREAMGFRVLRNLDERREVCTSCHNAASPTFKGFDLRQFSRKIAHWVDNEDTDYRAEAGRESARRARAAIGAGMGAAGAAEAARQANRAKAEQEAASRAAQARAEDEAKRRAGGAGMAAGAGAGAAGAAGAGAAGAGAAASAEAMKAEKAERAKKAEMDARAREAAQAAEAQRAEQEARAAAAAASAAAAAAKAEEEAEAKRRAAAPPPAPTPAPAPASDNPLAHFLKDVDDVIVLNKEGVKYNSLKFSHAKHAGNEYMPGGNCQTCHHTQESNESPESCNTCHNIGGDAEEEKAKKRYAHNKKKPFPLGPDQEQVSCAGCHKSMNDMLKAGERQGEKAPNKCTNCHTRKES
jgi:hypothetical protein